MTEKRASKRTDIELAASFGVPEANELSDGATILNISRGGFCITTDEPMLVSKKYTLDIEIAKDSHIQINVQAVWTRRAQNDAQRFVNGVRILDDSGENFKKFIEFYTKQIGE